MSSVGVNESVKTLAILLEATRKQRNRPTADGLAILQSFQEENGTQIWNPNLVESVEALEYVGFVRPNTLLVSGFEVHLNCLRDAWIKRCIKPPRHYNINSLGDFGGIEMREVRQTEFVPLPDVLCLLISDLNSAGRPATLVSLVDLLHRRYRGMSVPRQEILLGTLASLEAEGKIYEWHNHYFVSTPLMVQQFQQKKRKSQQPAARLPLNPFFAAAAALPYQIDVDFDRELQLRQVCTTECQTGPSVVNGVPPYKPSAQVKSAAMNTATQCSSAQETNAPEKVPIPRSGSIKEKEKQGFFARLFRRSKSRERNDKKKDESKSAKEEKSKLNKKANEKEQQATADRPAVFSAQFPPTQWLLPETNNRPAAGDGKVKRPTEQQRQPTALVVEQQQRFCTFPENLSGGGANRRRREQRPSRVVKQQQQTNKELFALKYVSSSSEFVNYCGAEGRESRRRSESDERLSVDSCCQRRTSTPAADRGDSAFSPSPQVDEATSDSNKYSSWSGSEAQHQRPRRQDEHVEHAVVDHTYINFAAEKTTAPDRIYENLADKSSAVHADSTNFENLTTSTFVAAKCIVEDDMTFCEEERLAKRLTSIHISSI